MQAEMTSDSLNVTPCLARNNSLYGVLANSVASRVATLRLSASESEPNVTNGIWSEFCRMRRFAKMHGRALVPPPLYRIRHVVGWRSFIQMGRIAARGIVARMQAVRLRKSSVCKEKGDAMRQDDRLPESHPPIFITIPIANPRPTLVVTSPFNVGPKPLGSIFPLYAGTARFKAESRKPPRFCAPNQRLSAMFACIIEGHLGLLHRLACEGMGRNPIPSILPKITKNAPFSGVGS